MEGIPISSLYLARQSAGRRRYVRHIQRRRLRVYLHPFFRKTHHTRELFVLLSQLRSGSHLVQSLISQHPQVHCDAEMFKMKRSLSPKRLLKNAAKARPESVFGFMLKPYNPKFNQGSSTKKWIEWLDGEGFKLVYLKRADALRQALSIYLALERRIWVNQTGTPSRVEPVRIDPLRLLRIREFIRSWEEVERAWVDALPNIQFSYESDLESSDCHQQTADRIFRFVGVDPVPVNAEIEPVLPKEPRSYVANWEEVTLMWNRKD